MLHFMMTCIDFWHDHHLVLLLCDLFTFWMTSFCVFSLEKRLSVFLFAW